MYKIKYKFILIINFINKKINAVLYTSKNKLAYSIRLEVLSFVSILFS